MSELVQLINDLTFKEACAAGIVLIDFYADWCGPCRMMTPVIDQFAQDMKGRISVFKLDIDASPKTTQELQVTSIPTLILLQNGKEIKRIVGLKDLVALKALVEASVKIS